MRDRRLGEIRCAGMQPISVQSSPAHLNPGADVAPVHAGHSVLQLQRKYGNRYVQRLMASGKQATRAAIEPAVESVIEQARAHGQALGQGERAEMEQVFGADFSGVRIHTDSQANVLSRSLNAVAFTSGQDIFFLQGAHDPASSRGRELLAHELTHVAQQSRDPFRNELTLGEPKDAYEREADQMAQHVVSSGKGEEYGAGLARAGGLQKVGDQNPVIRRQGAAASPQPDLLVVGDPAVSASLAIVHANDSFDVQWVTGNLGAGTSVAFKDKLQVFRVSNDTNQCAGSDADLGNPIYDSDNDSNANLQEGPIGPGQRGPLMAATVGPFTSGSYRLTVTVNSDGGEANESNTANNSTFNCIDIVPSADAPAGEGAP